MDVCEGFWGVFVIFDLVLVVHSEALFVLYYDLGASFELVCPLRSRKFMRLEDHFEE